MIFPAKKICSIGTATFLRARPFWRSRFKSTGRERACRDTWEREFLTGTLRQEATRKRFYAWRQDRVANCSIAPCPSLAQVKGVCRKHYARRLRTGRYGPGVGVVPRGHVRSFAPKACRVCLCIKPIEMFRSTKYGTCKRCNGIKGICRKREISVEAYHALFALQGGLCAICSSPFGDVLPDFDHDHETGEPRGLLCGICNIGLPAIERFPEFPEKAVTYLLHPPFARLYEYVQISVFAQKGTNAAPSH